MVECVVRGENGGRVGIRDRKDGGRREVERQEMEEEGRYEGKG